MKQSWRYQGPLVAWAVIIFILSSIPQVARLSLMAHGDKVVHTVVYGLLTWFAHRAFHYQDLSPALRRHATLMSILFAVMYGLTDEYHQSFVPGRVSSLLDLLADLVGSLAAAGIIHWRKRTPAASAAD